MSSTSKRMSVAVFEVIRSTISKCFLQIFPTPGKLWYLALSISLKILFELPGRADPICGKDQILKLSCSGVKDARKIIRGDVKIISQCETNRRSEERRVGKESGW